MAKGHVTEYPKIRLGVARTAEADMKMKQQDKQCIAIAEKIQSEQRLTSVPKWQLSKVKDVKAVFSNFEYVIKYDPNFDSK